MVSDDQIMKTQTCFLQEMAQKERIQPSTVDLVHFVPFCLSLVPPTHLADLIPTSKYQDLDLDKGQDFFVSSTFYLYISYILSLQVRFAILTL